MGVGQSYQPLSREARCRCRGLHQIFLVFARTADRVWRRNLNGRTEVEIRRIQYVEWVSQESMPLITTSGTHLGVNIYSIQDQPEEKYGNLRRNGLGCRRTRRIVAIAVEVVVQVVAVFVLSSADCTSSLECADPHPESPGLQCGNNVHALCRQVYQPEHCAQITPSVLIR